jgi:hypothetical protein
LRAFLRLDKSQEWSSTRGPADPNGPLKPFDLITKIGDREIDNTGMVSRDHLR